ncbi:hypothetical protein EPUS_03791 [Endocarpon pusillum Z07020]|uniref:Enoyl-CoA hydratase n=1 Tax=Endocarpon pusillum (strain Z07020 / HMAS-L-300199) TaxID=1263415 RepID=U1G907_ENDPU|nr:uncharacterized protein EPUS_03791 [Endocarpon pusillum Z07020]ERF68473.1 hypothetical protein EPUS_03791 [Endocarpon pusillum Z07020]
MDDNQKAVHQDQKTSSTTHTQLILIDIQDDGTTVVTLNRPQKRNALSAALIADLNAAFRALERNDSVRAIVLTGSPGGPFSAGADLGELKHISTSEAYKIQYLKGLSDGITQVRKPIIASIEGFALGGGFELALMCDVIFVAENAHLGLPELKVGTIPGVGGTQRLTRLVGKHLAMKLILTGSSLPATQFSAYIPGLHVLPAAEVLPAAKQCAKDIAEKSGPVVALAKQAILAAESGLDSGFAIERGLYYSSFDLQDKSEGISAFLEKRKPEWTHQ